MSIDKAVSLLPLDDDLQWLVQHADYELSSEGLPEDPLRLAAFFRRRHSPHRSRMLVELRELRERAATKFGRAHEMFFTRVGLEQATGECLAAYKARRFPARAPVVDLCCGLGGDAIGLAGRGGPLTAVDKDAATAFLAAANLHALGLDKLAQVNSMDVRDVDLRRFEAWHLDPDRRCRGARRSAAERGEPPLSDFLDSPRWAEDGAIKLAPATDVAVLPADRVELEWLGHRRECQQLVVWFGSLARHPGKRAATWLWHRGSSGEYEKATVVEQAVERAPVTDCLDGYLYEPRPPVLAAKLEDVLAARYSLKRIARDIPYFQSESPVENEPLLTGFEILESLPIRVTTLCQHLARRDARVTEVKKRGVKTDPNQLQRLLPRKGGLPVSVILVPTGKSSRAIVARRIGGPASDS